MGYYKLLSIVYIRLIWLKYIIYIHIDAYLYITNEWPENRLFYLAHHFGNDLDSQPAKCIIFSKNSMCLRIFFSWKSKLMFIWKTCYVIRADLQHEYIWVCQWQWLNAREKRTLFEFKCMVMLLRNSCFFILFHYVG